MFPPITSINRSFWMSEPDALSRHRTTQQLPKECDIAIIGSGYAGATMSYYIQKDSDASIVMLEARETCSGATGRNGGHLKPDAFYSFTKYAALYGAEEAERLLQFEQDHVPAMTKLIQEEGIDCDFVLTRALDLFMAESEGEYARKSLEMRAAAGGNVADIQIVDPSRLQASSRTSVRASFGATYPAGSLHPYKFVHHLLKLALRRGMNLQTYTPVTKAHKHGDHWYLETERGTLRAKKCVFATNAYTASLIRSFDNKIIPVRGTVSQIALPKSYARLENTYGIRMKGADSDYMICRQDHKVILGGAKSTFLSQPGLWYNVTDDGENICPESRQYFESYFDKFFGVADSKCEKVWSGILGYSNDFLPYVGELPSTERDQSDGFVIAAFHGHGMPRVLLCAKSLAAKITGRTAEVENIPKAYVLTAERMKNQTNHILKDMTGHLSTVNGEERLAKKVATADVTEPLEISSKL